MLKAGQIDIKVLFKSGKANMLMKGIGKANDEGKKESSQKSEKKKPVIHAQEPSIATKSLAPEDLFEVSMQISLFLDYHQLTHYMQLITIFNSSLFQAAPEHSNFGVELKEITKKE
jgi:hypothetical protein